MLKVRKAESSFLYATRRLVLFYISAKYHRNIPKGNHVTELTQNLFQIKQRVITPKVRLKPELSILYATLISSWSTFLPNIIKIFQRVFKLQVTEWTRSFTPMPTRSIPKKICPPTPIHSLVVGGWWFLRNVPQIICKRNQKKISALLAANDGRVQLLYYYQKS